MKKDNRGMSLLELVVVIAIMAVLVGTIGIGIKLISGKPADECANKLKAVLQNNRVTTMGKLDARLNVYADAGGVYVTEIIDGNSTTSRIGDAGVVIEYRVTGDPEGSYTTLGSTPLEISFSRASGAFNPLPGTSTYVLEIRVIKADVIRTLQLSTHTGKITLK